MNKADVVAEVAKLVKEGIAEALKDLLPQMQKAAQESPLDGIYLVAAILGGIGIVCLATMRIVLKIIPPKEIKGNIEVTHTQIMEEIGNLKDSVFEIDKGVKDKFSEIDSRFGKVNEKFRELSEEV